MKIGDFRAYEREAGIAEQEGFSTPLGAAREIQEGIAVDPLLVDS
ncbi:MAG: hypothetical protein ACRCZA_01290 [Shewanella sp.]